jgi:hypothetical protein
MIGFVEAKDRYKQQKFLEGKNMRDKGTMMKVWGSLMAIWAGLMVMLMVSAPSLAADNPDGYFLKNEHKFQQDVEGSGYSMVYHKVDTKTLQLKNYMHGSGTIDAATLIRSNQTETKGYVQDRDTLVYGSEVKTQNSAISFVEQNEMTYAPVAFAYGTGYYARNPIVYNSKLKEKTVGKSYQEGVMIHHQIEYASAFIKDIGVDLECKEPWPPKNSYSSSPINGYGLARMKIDEQVTEGAIHVGQLLTDPKYGWKKPLVEIDENYVGSFRMVKDMEVKVSKSASKTRGDWLTCCFGGYGGMEADDKLWGEDEIFDCTCRDVAWGNSWSDKSTEQSL